MNSNDIIRQIKDCRAYGEADLRHIKLLASLLSEDELQGLVDELKGNPDTYTKWRIVWEVLASVSSANSYKQELYEKTRGKNEPVSELLEWYANKKSGKVVYARKKLHERFLHIDYADQVQVMNAFLDGGKTDREWCYNVLRKWWTDELEESVIKIWDRYHEERCGWLFPKYLPTDVIKERLDDLSFNSNYYQMCKRLVEEPWFTVDKDKLREQTDGSRYLWIMSQTDSGLSVKEAFGVLYRWIAVAIHYYVREMDPDDSHFLSRENTSFILEVNHRDVDQNFCMYNLNNVENMLSSMCRMGLQKEVLDFLKFDCKIHDVFMRQHERDLLRVVNGEMNNGSHLESLYAEYFKYLAEQFPKDYTEELYYWKKTVDKFREVDAEMIPVVTHENLSNTKYNQERYSYAQTHKNKVAEVKTLSEDDLKAIRRENPSFNELIDKLGLEVDSVDVFF